MSKRKMRIKMKQARQFNELVLDFNGAAEEAETDNNNSMVYDKNKYYGYIYKIVNKITGECYIGQSQVGEDINTYYGSGNNIKKAIEKYGYSKFKKEILCRVERGALEDIELDYEEIYWIAKYRADNKSLYNISMGGKGGSVLLKEELCREWGINIENFNTPEDQKVWYENIEKSGKDEIMRRLVECRETVRGYINDEAYMREREDFYRDTENLTVVCPRCKAEINEVCKTLSGRYCASHHDRKMKVLIEMLKENRL